MEKSKYDKQAEDFLAKTGTKIKIKFDHWGPHFIGEDESRDIYRVNISRNGKRYSFKFGQSIVNSNGGGTPPSAYDILSTIEKYDPDDFESFCENYGYDPDSRKAEKIYKAVVKEYKRLSELFSNEELEEMAEIQ